MGRIFARVDVEDDLLGRILLPAVDGSPHPAKPLQSFAFQKPDRIPVGAVLQARECWLRGERTIDAVDDTAHRRIVAQERRVVGVLVAGCDLVDPLPHQIEHRVADVAPIAPVRSG